MLVSLERSQEVHNYYKYYYKIYNPPSRIPFLWIFKSWPTITHMEREKHIKQYFQKKYNIQDILSYIGNNISHIAILKRVDSFFQSLKIDFHNHHGTLVSPLESFCKFCVKNSILLDI